VKSDEHSCRDQPVRTSATDRRQSCGICLPIHVVFAQFRIHDRLIIQGNAAETARNILVTSSCKLSTPIHRIASQRNTGRNVRRGTSFASACNRPASNTCMAAWGVISSAFCAASKLRQRLEPVVSSIRLWAFSISSRVFGSCSRDCEYRSSPIGNGEPNASSNDVRGLRRSEGEAPLQSCRRESGATEASEERVTRRRFWCLGARSLIRARCARLLLRGWL
jgi:hypothetical protein